MPRRQLWGWSAEDYELWRASLFGLRFARGSASKIFKKLVSSFLGSCVKNKNRSLIFSAIYQSYPAHLNSFKTNGICEWCGRSFTTLKKSGVIMNQTASGQSRRHDHTCLVVFFFIISLKCIDQDETTSFRISNNIVFLIWTQRLAIPATTIDKNETPDYFPCSLYVRLHLCSLLHGTSDDDVMRGFRLPSSTIIDSAAWRQCFLPCKQMPYYQSLIS